MKKKDQAGENIVCLLDDFRMIGENGFHILLLQLWVSKAWACLGDTQDGVKPSAALPMRTASRAVAGLGHMEVAGGERLYKEIFGCSGEGQKAGGSIFSLLVNP